MKKSKSIFKIERHPIILGKDISSTKGMFVAGLLILTGILAPIGMIMFLTGAHHRANKITAPTAPKKKKKR